MKKGFTLVEVLGVLVVMSIIATITYFVVINVMKNANEALDEGTKKLLYTAAERYLDNNVSLSSNGRYTVTVETLINKDLISKTFIDSQSDTNLTTSSCVIVNISNGKKNYEFSYTC